MVIHLERYFSTVKLTNNLLLSKSNKKVVFVFVFFIQRSTYSLFNLWPDDVYGNSL